MKINVPPSDWRDVRIGVASERSHPDHIFLAPTEPGPLTCYCGAVTVVAETNEHGTWAITVESREA